MGDATGGGTLVPMQAAPPAISPFRDATERQRFHVELRGERAISWKKLLKTLPPPPTIEAPPGANPALEARLAPENALLSKGSSSAPNRFSNVIEKIERLYQGVDSDDEPVDADDDQYNTDDSFIDDEELDDYFAVDRARTKHSGFFINKGKLENTNDSVPLSQPPPKKRKRKDAASNASKSSQDMQKKPKPGHEELPRAHANFSDVELAVGECLVNKQPETQAQAGVNIAKGPEHAGFLKPKALMVNTGLASGSKAKLPTSRKNILSPSKMRLKQTMGERKDSPKLALKHFTAKDDKNVKKPNGVKLALERAIEELKMAVADLPVRVPSASVTPEADNPNADPSGTVRSKRLPREMKLKLAKVARLAAKQGQGKVPDECVERLMGFLGHLMQLKTLKRNLKEMVETAMVAKQEKEGRFMHMKRDFVELIRSNISSMREKADQSFDDFQSLPVSDSKPRHYKWDVATEDRLRELYEHYFEGTDLNVASHSRKLYSELAELWPEGWMDKEGIKEAVFRSKERTKQKYKEMVLERDKKFAEVRKKAAEERKTAVERFDLNKRMTEVVPVASSSKDVLSLAGKCAAVRAPKLVLRQENFLKDKHQQQQHQQQQQQQLQPQRSIDKVEGVKQEESEVVLYKFRKSKPHDAATAATATVTVTAVPAPEADPNLKLLSSSQRLVEGDRSFGGGCSSLT